MIICVGALKLKREFLSSGHPALGNVSSEKTDSLLLFAQLSSLIGEGGTDEAEKREAGEGGFS